MKGYDGQVASGPTTQNTHITNFVDGNIHSQSSKNHHEHNESQLKMLLNLFLKKKFSKSYLAGNAVLFDYDHVIETEDVRHAYTPWCHNKCHTDNKYFCRNHAVEQWI